MTDIANLLALARANLEKMQTESVERERELLSRGTPTLPEEVAMEAENMNTEFPTVWGALLAGVSEAQKAELDDVIAAASALESVIRAQQGKLAAVD